MKKCLLLGTVLGIIGLVLIILTIPAPAPAAEKTIHWRMATCWPPSIPLIEADRKFVEIVNSISSGRLKIKLFTAGEIVPAFELLDAVANGVVQGGFDWPGYWAGKNSAFGILGAFPMLLTGVDYQLWIHEGGGAEIFNEVYGKLGLVYFSHSCMFSESGVRANKPIYKLEDYKGLKIRMSGRPQGEILKQLGASQVMLSGGEVYQALEKGTIDGGEFSMPSLDWPMGFGEVTKFWCSPGWHQPGSPLGIMINEKAWAKLPDDLKLLVEYAAMATYTWGTSYFEYGNIDATRKFLEKGTTITRLNDKDLLKLQEIAMQVLVKESKKNPLFAKVARSQVKFLKDIAKWRTIGAPFGYGRNIPNLPEIE